MEHILRSDYYRNTHRASVVSILGEDAPPVSSKGDRFYNIDRWTAKVLMSEMSTWVRGNPGIVPSRGVIAAWVQKVNAVPPPRREIVIAATPAQLGTTVALALVGGGYHEAFHTLWSRRRALDIDDVCEILLPRWGTIPNWTPYLHLVTHLGDLIEDIRIENRGCDRFPGVEDRLAYLQDFILHQEDEANAASSGGGSPLWVALGAFRDLGLGYATPDQDDRLEKYRVADPDAYALVETGGLAPLVEQAAELGEEDDLGFLRVAMDSVTLLVDLAGQVPESPPLSIGSPDGEPTGTMPSPAETILQLASNMPGSIGLLDASSALGAAFEGTVEVVLQQCEPGEAPWRPYDPGLDEEALVSPSTRGIAYDTIRARAMLSDVRQECSFLRARLRSLVLGMTERAIVHGVPRGTVLSERMLVETRIAMEAGEDPDRAFIRVGERKDVSTAAVLVIDQSGSMRGGAGVRTWNVVADGGTVRIPGSDEGTLAYVDGKMAQTTLLPDGTVELVGKVPAGTVVSIRGRSRTKVEDAARAMLAVVDPLEHLGCTVMVAGFRDGVGSRANIQGFHRTHGVRHDVFKRYDERLGKVIWRFANVKADGGTPMADSVMYGIDALVPRRETHRILFVFTDGIPDTGHVPVIRWLLRRARRQGIHVIGVGMGHESRFVQDVFPDHVWAEDISLLPPALLQKLNRLLDLRGTVRGTGVPSSG